MLQVNEFISAKRFGGRHTSQDLKAWIRGYMSGEVADYQMSAWLMAVCINGLDIDETVALNEAVISSGDTIDLSSIPGITVDKHSTGGVGDKTTLVLGPLLAAAGLTVAKMSGRGLGITGGTLDKLESIPGYSVKLTKEQFLDQATRIGCVLTGQTGNLVPADKKMYALRDVTGTVESIPLIAASVMSKKIASGASMILLDVKVGSGAFMKDIESARELARRMILIGEKMGRKVIVAITGMDQPLGLTVGNTVEVAEAIETLKGRGPVDLRDLCIELGAMLLATSRDSSLAAARDQLTELLDSGAALRKFREVVIAQGGDPRVIDDLSILPQPSFTRQIISSDSGYIQSLDACTIGRAAGLLGAGREKVEDSVDPTAGVILHKKIGDRVETGELLATIQFSHNIDAEPIKQLAQSAFVIGPSAPPVPQLIQETIGQ